MTSLARRRTPVLVACAGVVAIAVAAALLTALVRGGQDNDDTAQDRPPTVITDLCAALEPALPPDLGLAGGRSSNDSRNDTEIATCLVAGTDGAELEVRVTGYELPDGDPDGELEQLVAIACDGVERQYAAGFTEDSASCSGQDSESTTEPLLTSATMITTLPTLNAVASVVLTDRALPAIVGAYTTAVAYAVVSAGADLAG
ncbi:hypothetical protein LRP67_03630 [Nocardioides sp. cx-169]|uniref:hypothetical protein n=1 Tax=Nocardioides sp. cx-169 TaxID=2899080 RepID=UPI001E2E2196|nr:hypothetical protein [Nocardioides sp. cx-169]MCD4533169.1 hypothetical protein [Nocardioides sp. cx-169]